MHPVEEVTIKFIRSLSGDYEQVESQVYDVMLADDFAKSLQLPTIDGLCRVTFDSEALAEHPKAQLLAFGHPTLDQIFAMAHQQGAVGKVYLSGFNLQPHQLLAKVKQQLQLHKDLKVQFGTSRVLHFTLWFHWFQATFLSDEKTQYVFEVGVDQYFGRLTRHFRELLETAQTVSLAPVPYPEAGGVAPLDAYLLASSEALVRMRSLMRNYKENLATYLARESQQVTKYFDGMVAEVEERQSKAASQNKEVETFQQQKKSLDLERKMRLTELQKKMTLKVDLKLLNLLSVVLPKIATPLKLTGNRNVAVDLTVVWNPLSNTVEPLACPHCRNPTLEFFQAQNGAIQCAQCYK